MITYSTNFMGPINLQWYRDRGIAFINKGTPATLYAGGRIDVYGVSENDYYGGKTEIGLPIMTATSFNSLSDFLRGFKSSSLLTYDQIITLYYAEGNPKIEYAPNKVVK